MRATPLLLFQQSPGHAQLLERMDIIFAEIDPNGHVAPFLRREKQRSIAEADIQPASPLSITSGTLDHSSRYRALALHVVTDGLIGLRLGEDERGGACIEIAFGKDMTAVNAFVPGYDRRKPWLVDWMFRTIGAKDRWNIAAFAAR